MEKLRSRLRLELIKNYEFEEIIKQQSKLIFAGTHKSYERCDGSSFKQKKKLGWISQFT